MKIVVLGAGIIGVCSAWYLAADGHEVTVLEREAGAGLQTTFANGGQISASYAEPWANPQAPRKILKWLGREDSPLLFRLRADPLQWRWALQFLIECLPSRTQRNTIACLNLALYSRSCLQELRGSVDLDYDGLQRGILQFYTDRGEFEHGFAMARLMRRYGCDREVKSIDQCVAIEPALAWCRHLLVGGIYTATDESGDAHRFTHALAAESERLGVRFRYRVDVQSLVAQGREVSGVKVVNEEKGDELITADAYVVALGSYTPMLLRPIGIRTLIYPAKGYSATIDVGAHLGAPTVSLTDLARKIVITRLGDRLRVAGTAELTGYDNSLNPTRCQALVKRTFELFPEAGQREGVRFWAGLRPATPSNMPLIGKTKYSNLFLNSGHGTLGWTMSCGSGKALAALVAGRAPDVNFSFLGQPS